MRNHAWNPCTLQTNEKEFHLFLWSWAQVIKMIVPDHFNSLSSKLSLMVPSSMLKQNDELIQFLPCGAEEKQDSTHPILPIFHSEGTLHLPFFSPPWLFYIVILRNGHRSQNSWLWDILIGRNSDLRQNCATELGTKHCWRDRKEEQAQIC